jgi:hypothetical protein
MLSNNRTREEIMKILATALFCLGLLAVAPAFGDSAAPIPDTWSKTLQTSTQKMVRAGIPADDAVAMTSAMIQARFSQQQIKQAQKVVVKAHQKGLPVEPVINKAFEGMAKHVRPHSVIKAMERVSSRYGYAFRQASRLSHQKTDVEKLGHILAAGLAAGLKHKDVEKMIGRLHKDASHLSRADQRTLAAAALVTARDMARQGVTSAHTGQVVSRALQQGFKTHEMQSLHQAFMARSTEMPADQVARSFSKSLHDGTFSAMDARGSLSKGMGMESHGKTPAGMGAEHGVVGHGVGDMGQGAGNVGHGVGDMGHGSGDHDGGGSGGVGGSGGSSGSGVGGSGGDSGSGADGGHGGGGVGGSGGDSGSGADGGHGGGGVGGSGGDSGSGADGGHGGGGMGGGGSGGGSGGSPH